MRFPLPAMQGSRLRRLFCIRKPRDTRARDERASLPRPAGSGTPASGRGAAKAGAHALRSNTAGRAAPLFVVTGATFRSGQPFRASWRRPVDTRPGAAESLEDEFRREGKNVSLLRGFSAGRGTHQPASGSSSQDKPASHRPGQSIKPLNQKDFFISFQATLTKPGTRIRTAHGQVSYISPPAGPSSRAALQVRHR